MNLQVPYRRTSIGIDSLDLELDLLVTSELEVVVKDEAQVDQSAGLGRFSTDDATAIHALGARVKGQIESEGAWWDQAWSTWTPPPSMLVAPSLIDGWADVDAEAVTDLLAAP